MELTKEHFDKSMQGLFDYVETNLKPINERFDKIEATLEVHTRALDRLLKDMENRETEKLVFVHRMERIENWAKQVAEKTGIKIEFKN